MISALRQPAVQIRLGTCVFDTRSRQLFRDGRDIGLSDKARDLLKLLVQYRPRAISRAEILDRLWPDTIVPDDAPAVLVDELRSAIGDSGGDPRWIRMVPGVGYALAPGVEDEDDASASGEHWVLTWATRRFVLAEGENILGRDPDARVPLDADLISRRHARIVVSSDGAVIEDLGSKNGTYVDSTRVTGPHPLAPGDRIRIGDLTLTVRRSASPRPAAER